jgi:hypothetical protein
MIDLSMKAHPLPHSSFLRHLDPADAKAKPAEAFQQPAVGRGE